MSISINNQNVAQIHTPYGWLTEIDDSNSNIIWQNQGTIDDSLCITFLEENVNNYIYIQICDAYGPIITTQQYSFSYKKISDSSYTSTTTDSNGRYFIDNAYCVFLQSNNYPTWYSSYNEYHINIRCKRMSGNEHNVNNDLDVPFILSGNIASLGPSPSTQLPSNFGYRSLFSNSSVVSAETLVLPFTTFLGNSYNQCIGYGNMFENCTNLLKAPELIATTLAAYCYMEMFKNCTNLNYIKCMIQSQAQSYGYTLNWVVGVGSTGTFIGKSGSESGWSSMNAGSGIPSGWTPIWI